MPARTITTAGRTWTVYPSGRITPLAFDEFGLIFVSGSGDDREVRVTRYSPLQTRSREQSLIELSEADLVRLLQHSQPSDTSPEAGYLP